MYLQKVISRKTFVKKLVFVGVLKAKTKIAGSRSASGYGESITHRHKSADPDPDPDQKVTDPEHCFLA
jgi:hypothetical protein